MTFKMIISAMALTLSLNAPAMAEDAAAPAKPAPTLPAISVIAASKTVVTDRVLATGFFLPEGLVVNNSAPASGGGQPLLWQHRWVGGR